MLASSASSSSSVMAEWRCSITRLTWRDAGEMRARCGRDTREIRARYARDTREIRARYGRDMGEIGGAAPSRGSPCCAARRAISPLHLPYISPTFPHISPTSPSPCCAATPPSRRTPRRPRAAGEKRGRYGGDVGEVAMQLGHARTASSHRSLARYMLTALPQSCASA